MPRLASRAVPLSRRADWFTDEGIHVLELDADPTKRMAALADALSFELSWATDAERAPNRQVLHHLMMQLWRLSAG